MPIAIRYLKISNYRSIDELELHDIPAFAVFAGANGSGKSNFFDALDFMSSIIKFGIDTALRQHGGFDNIYHVEHTETSSDTLNYSIGLTVDQKVTEYHLKILELLSNPYLRESISIDGKEIFSRDGANYRNHVDSEESFNFQLPAVAKKLQEAQTATENSKEFKKKFREFKREKNKILAHEETKKFQELNEKSLGIVLNTLTEFLRRFEDSVTLPTNISILLTMFQPLGVIFRNIRLYNIEPRTVKSFNSSIHDDLQLQRYGQNLAAVLRRLEKDDEVRETIIDWLQLIVPQLEIVQTETERLSGSAQLAFKETGTDKLFPAHLISDGTIYLLCLLVAMLDRPKIGITLIEEPERGLHPKAIMELVKGFREHSTIESPIWLTTHSESVVRMLKDNELWLVDKKDGKTQINPVRNIENLQLNLDEAWLSNALNGGLPW